MVRHLLLPQIVSHPKTFIIYMIWVYGVDRKISKKKEPSTKIKDVNILVPNKVVEVVFDDGTKQKSVCMEPDVFSLETAISVCISKQILGGTGKYNNAVRKGVKVYNDKVKKEAEERAEAERIEKKKRKEESKRLARMAKKKAEQMEEEKERQIEIQKEAYIRALRYMKDKN